MNSKIARRTLPPDEVQIYATNLDAVASPPSELAALLSDMEQLRAARFHSAHDRERYIVRRTILRLLLGAYLNVPPEGIEMPLGPHGKPAIAPAPGSPQLGFNLSHSDGTAVYAFAWNRRVGIDVEGVRRDIDYRGLAERFFAPGERAALGRVADDDLPERFFACWTRKEAVVKAHGAGLSLPLDTFEVSIQPVAEPPIVWASPDPAERWRLLSLTPQAGFIGALAVEGAPWTARIDMDFTF